MSQSPVRYKMSPKHEANEIPTDSSSTESHDSWDDCYVLTLGEDSEDSETGVLKVELAAARRRIQELTDTTTALKASNDETVWCYKYLEAEKEVESCKHRRQRRRLEEDDLRHKELIRTMEQELTETRRDNEHLREANAIMQGVNESILSQCEEEKAKLTTDVLCLVDGLSEDLKARKDATRHLLYPLGGLEQALATPRYLNDPEVARKIVDHYEARLMMQVGALRERLDKH